MLRKRFLFLIILSCGLGRDSANAQELVAWETFQDANIESNLHCFQAACRPEHPEVAYEFLTGELQATFYDFGMWRLNGFDGQRVAPSNNMSVRARMNSLGAPTGLGGVGTDQYYWAANGSPAQNRVNVGGGQFFDAVGSVGDFAAGREWITQLDVFPDHLEGYSWPVDDPQDVIDFYWERPVPIKPGVPVIWGNYGGSYTFKEAIVTDGHLGIGADVNRDGMRSTLDIDAIMEAARSGTNDPRYNYTSDLVVNDDDIRAWVHNGAKTYLGDANLDGQFDSTDIIDAFQAGHYEQDADAGWATGDWSGDKRFSSTDLVVAFQDGGYEQGPRTAVVAVPEPTSMTLGLAAACLSLHRFRRRNRG